MTAIENLKKLQRQILFGMRAFMDKKDGLCMNPFYSQSERSIEDNKDYAQEVYPKVFKHFLAGWFERHGTFTNFESDKRMISLII